MIWAARQGVPALQEGRRLRIVRPEAPVWRRQRLAPCRRLSGAGGLVSDRVRERCELLLSKAVSRRREIAVRLSLGASRTRLIRQLLTESFLLAIVAGITGVVMAYWTMDVIMAFVPPVDMPIDLGLRMDTTTLLFALGVSMVTGLIFGLAPALQASSNQTINALKEEGRSGSGGRTTGRLRSALVVAQVAVCLVLLVGDALLRLFSRASLSPASMARTSAPHRWTFPHVYPAIGIVNSNARPRAVQAIPACVRPHSDRAAAGFGGNNSTSVGVEGYVPRENEEIVINYSTIGPNYFETMGIPIREGREYNDTDTLQSPRTLVINESMAKRYWPEGKALGGKIRLGQNLAEVVGIVADSKYSNISERPLAQLFFPMARSEVSTLGCSLGGRRSRPMWGRPHASAHRATRGLRRATLNAHMHIAVFSQHVGTCSARGRARAVAGRDRPLRRHGLRGEPANAGARHPPGAGRIARLAPGHDRRARHEADDDRTRDRSGDCSRRLRLNRRRAIAAARDLADGSDQVVACQSFSDRYRAVASWIQGDEPAK